MNTDPWHFSRPSLKKQYSDFLAMGLSNAMFVLQQRRFRKTAFCLHDLGPIAEANRYLVAKASFWQVRLATTALLLHALKKSLERKTMTSSPPHLSPSGEGRGLSRNW